VELYDSDDVKQGEADNVEIPGGEATALPTLDADKFLTNDGSVMSWADVREVPDPTGSANKFLTTDGTALSWGNGPDDPVVPDIPTDGITDDTTGATIGKFKIQTGSATAPASGTFTTSKAVTFGTAYATCYHVEITVTSGAASGGPIVGYLSSAPGTTGFTAAFDVAEGDNANSTISSTVSFTWVAFGHIT
jgi:hypothetical protein